LTALVLTAWFFAVGISHSRWVPLVGDLAEYVNNPVRLLNGELPYRDFWLLHPPGEVLLPGAIYALGFGVNIMLLVTLAINVLVGLAAYFVVRRLARSNGEAVLGGVVVFFAGVPYDYGGFVCLQAYFLCLLGAAGFLIRHLQWHDRRSLFCAGLAVGLGAVFKFYLAGAAAAALCAAVWMEMRRRGCGLKESARLMGIYIAGALVAPIATTACFADLWPNLWYAIGVDSVSHATVLRPVYGHKLAEFWADAVPFLRDLRHDPFGWTPDGVTRLSRLVEMATVHVVPFLAGGLYWYSRRKGIVPRDLSHEGLLFFLLWGGLTFIRGFVRGGNTTALIQSATPLYLVLILLLRPLLKCARASRTVGASLAAASAVAALIGLGQWAVVLTVNEGLAFGRPGHRVVAPYGTLVFADPNQAAEIQSLIGAVVENTAEGDYVFVTPWNAPPLYALTRRRNPTYYDSLIDLTHRPSELKQRKVCEALLAHETRLVVHRPGWATGSNSFERACPLMDECLRENFEPFRQAGPFSVWRRKKTKDSANAANNARRERRG
jgi:hypothetical protein